jgi:hypothetical protein
MAHRIITLCFGEDASIPLLQAADLVAYVLRQERAGQRTPWLPYYSQDRGSKNGHLDYMAQAYCLDLRLLGFDFGNSDLGNRLDGLTTVYPQGCSVWDSG